MNAFTKRLTVADLYPMKTNLLTVTMLILFLSCLPLARGESRREIRNLMEIGVPILLYHRFGPKAVDSMTVSTPVFESHLEYLKDKGYAVIPLRQLVEYHLGKRRNLPFQSVVITVDDGHRSVYTNMFPLLKKYRLPVTLLLYPSALSNATYAMTWDQLRDMKETGLIEFQSHTFWHPNFRKDKNTLKPVEYETLVRMQFEKSKMVLEKQLEIQVNMLAWPFGIYDDDLIRKAVETGYVAAFTMERRHVKTSDNVMALPRYLMRNEDEGKAFGRMLQGPTRGQIER